MNTTTLAKTTRLSWNRSDIERRLCFPAAGYTGTNTFLTFLIGAVLTVAFYAIMFPFKEYYFVKMFYERGVIPYPITLLFCWSAAILFIKWRKLALQKKALDISVVPDNYDFVLSPVTAEGVIGNIHNAVDEPERFVLFNRIVRALSNLRNIGRISDVDEILRSQAENDEGKMESSYTLVRGFVWAIPVLGFIGTVLGLSKAIGGFGSVLATGAEISGLKVALQQVTGGLAVAFETTLLGLVGALFLQLFSTALQKTESEFLNNCEDYCHRNIVGKLRILPFEKEE